MELRELVAIFKKYQKTFVVTVVLFIVVGAIGYAVQPTAYATNLALNITRKGTQQTSDYRYDDFYRLQADERFADTVVSWLASPRIVADISADAGDVHSIGAIKAARLSSQMIAVTFKTNDADSGTIIAQSIGKILNQQANELNQSQQEDTWFTIQADQPVTALAKISFAILFLASLALGIFFGAWAVMVRHYWEKK